jgi:hypothetical protein
MWTIIRAVELKSFRRFDDGLSAALLKLNVLYVCMANQLIQYSLNSGYILKLVDLGSLGLGLIEFYSNVYVATKTIDSLTVSHYERSNLSIINVALTVSITDSCSAFYIQSGLSTFWYGLRDGSIAKFSLLEKSFVSMVFL